MKLRTFLLAVVGLTLVPLLGVAGLAIWWAHEVCGEDNVHVGIGKEVYFLSAEGLLMPAKKDQPPPDLRFFKPYNR